MDGYLSRRPYGIILAKGPRKAIAQCLTIMAYAEKAPRGNGCVHWLTLPWVRSDRHWGIQRRRCFFFSEFTIPVAQKASWLLNFGTGVLLSCVTWDISMSACFHTLQDLLDRPVRTRRCLGSFRLSCQVFAFCYTTTCFRQVFGNGVGGTVGYKPAPGWLPCSVGTL